MAKKSQSATAAAPSPAPAPTAAPTRKRYFVVNPSGAVHEVLRAHAQQLLKEIGFRMATAEEVAKAEAQNWNQVWDRPICKPWTDNPDQAGEEPQAEG